MARNRYTTCCTIILHAPRLSVNNSCFVQITTQVAEQGGYGKGVESILVKKDPSLPLFVAIA